jgi:hypothetical protein
MSRFSTLIVALTLVASASGLTCNNYEKNTCTGCPADVDLGNSKENAARVETCKEGETQCADFTATVTSEDGTLALINGGCAETATTCALAEADLREGREGATITYSCSLCETDACNAADAAAAGVNAGTQTSASAFAIVSVLLLATKLAL